jgi:hypothetical protein
MGDNLFMSLMIAIEELFGSFFSILKYQGSKYNPSSKTFG